MYPALRIWLPRNEVLHIRNDEDETGLAANWRLNPARNDYGPRYLDRFNRTTVIRTKRKRINERHRLLLLGAV